MNNSTAFLAIYAGQTIATARIVAVTAEEDIVRAAVASLVERADPAQVDVLRQVSTGKVRALRAILRRLSSSPATSKESSRRRAAQGGGR